MSDKVQNFRDLIIWQKSMCLAKEVYRLSKVFPRDERYALTNQIRRAALSVPSNIAEGHARQGREFCQFLSIARGSLAEVETQLLFAVEVGYLKSDELRSALSLAEEIARMAAVLAKRVRQASNP
jgi:four helix bundle protein